MTTDLAADRLFVRDLLKACRVPSGGRVIDVGCGDGATVGHCVALGRSAAGIDDADVPDNGLDLHRGVLANSVPFAAGEADLAIVRGMDAYAGDLSGIESLISTANLLSCLRPLGRAAFLLEDAVAPAGSAETDRQAEIIEHFAVFPGRCRVTPVSEGFGRFLSPSFLLGRRPRRGGQFVIVQIPKQPISRLEWHGYAREAAMAGIRRAA